jgi:hypothetical protein
MIGSVGGSFIDYRLVPNVITEAKIRQPINLLTASGLAYLLPPRAFDWRVPAWAELVFAPAPWRRGAVRHGAEVLPGVAPVVPAL